jgi:hypothetical protein
LGGAQAARLSAAAADRKRMTMIIAQRRMVGGAAARKFPTHPLHAATIESLPMAFEMVKAMQADRLEWGEGSASVGSGDRAADGHGG